MGLQKESQAVGRVSVSSSWGKGEGAFDVAVKMAACPAQIYKYILCFQIPSWEMEKVVPGQGQIFLAVFADR